MSIPPELLHYYTHRPYRTYRGDKIICVGYMRKQRKNLKTWKREYYVLRRDHFCVYRNSDAEKPRRIYFRSDIYDVFLKTNNGPPTLVVITEFKTLYLQADKGEELLLVYWFKKFSTLQFNKTLFN